MVILGRSSASIHGMWNDGVLKVLHEENIAIDTSFCSYTGLDSLHSLRMLMSPLIHLINIPPLVQISHCLAVRLQAHPARFTHSTSRWDPTSLSSTLALQT